MNKHSLRLLFMVACAMLLSGAPGAVALAEPASPAPAAVASASAAIPEDALLQPEDLAQMLRSSSPAQSLILQVGSHVLYAEAHIPGAEYVGAAGQDTGLHALDARVKDLEHNRLLVIYCGCCPWNKCPNIRPAFWRLRGLGFTNVKALYLADNFGADWAGKGYPVAKGR